MSILTKLPFTDVSNITKLPDRILGAGANGTCYVGIDLSSSGRLYAVKEIPLIPASSSSNNYDDSTENKDIPVIAKNLLSEISICASIPPHPNVVAYYGSRISKQVVSNPFGQDDDDETNSSCFCVDIIMEYLPGGSVSSLLRSLNSTSSSILFPESLTKRYVADLLLGVDHLHNVAHVVHRDLKGDNLLLDATGEYAKVCDYGTATKRFASSKKKGNNINNVHQDPAFDLISPSNFNIHHQKHQNSAQGDESGFGRKSLLFRTACGTASWTAPEVASAEFNNDNNNSENENSSHHEDQNQSSGCYSSSADIWSLGCCAFEFLTGAPPSYGIDPSNQFAIFFAIATNESLRPDLEDPVQVPSAKIRSEISAEAKDFVMNCCCVRDPAKRWRVEQLLTHPWVKKEVEEKRRKINLTMNDNSPSRAAGIAKSTKNLGLSLSMEGENDDDDEKDSENERKDEDEENFGQGTKMFRDSIILSKTSGEGFMMPNGAFVDM